MSAHAAITTPAIVVRLVDFGEADRIVGLYTESAGLVSAVARSARRSRKRFAGSLQSGHLLTVTFVRGGGTLARLESAVLVEPYLGISSDLGRLEEAAQVLRAVRHHMPAGMPDAELFRVLVGHLAILDHAAADAERLVGFRLALFDRLGVGPELERCVICGRPAPPSRTAGFDPAAGGLVCRACGGGPLLLAPATRELARRLRASAGAASKNEAEDADQAAPVARAEPRVVLELGRALDALEKHHLSHRQDH